VCLRMLILISSSSLTIPGQNQLSSPVKHVFLTDHIRHHTRLCSAGYRACGIESPQRNCITVAIDSWAREHECQNHMSCVGHCKSTYGFTLQGKCTKTTLKACLPTRAQRIANGLSTQLVNAYLLTARRAGVKFS